jgi:hypothetical protein
MAKPQKKGIGKSIVIALGILVVILGVSNVYVYSSLQGQITNLQNQITLLNAQTTLLNAQISNLTNIVNLAKSTVWVNNQTITQPSYHYTSWTKSASYAGYVSVNVQSSTTSNTYVEVIWSAYSGGYDNRTTVGASGTAVFPVLPSSTIEIRVGNTNLLNGATETVTVTYYY